MIKKMIALLMIVTLCAAAAGLTGCTTNDDGSLGAGSVYTSNSYEDLATATAQTVDTASAEVSASAAPTLEVTAAPTSNVNDPEDDAEDLFCGWFITFNRLKPGKQYKVGSSADVDGISIYVTFPSTKSKYVLSADCVDDASCKLLKKGSNGVKCKLSGKVYIKSGTKIFKNNVFQKPNGELYMVGNAAGTTVGKNENAIASSGFSSFASKGSTVSHTVKINLKVKNSTYSKLVFEQYGRKNVLIDSTDATMYEFPEYIELDKKTKKIFVKKYMANEDGEYSLIGTEKYKRKKISSEFSTWFMGDNLFAAQRILEIIK